MGYLPRGPATAGALLGAAAFHVLGLQRGAGLIAVLLVVAVGSVLSQRIIAKTGDPDPQAIIIDEVAGAGTAMLWLPRDWWVALAAAAVFRVFDKKKFGPAAAFDRRGDGLGVMMDDVMAGIFANIVLRGGIFIYERILN